MELTAIHQTPVDIIGEAMIPFHLGQRTVEDTALVSRQTIEVITSLEFQEKCNCVCVFWRRGDARGRSE